MAYGNPFFQNIFYNSPGSVKNLFATFFELRSHRSNYGTFYHQFSDYLKKSATSSSDEVISKQRHHLVDFLKFASQHTLYYKTLFQENGFDPYREDALSKLEDIPLLTKEIIRKNFDSIITTKTLPYPVKWRHTSGTTGAGLRFPETMNTLQEYHAIRDLQFAWATNIHDRKPRVAVLAGHPVTKPSRTKPPFWVVEAYSSKLILSSVNISENTIKYYIRALEKFKPDILNGYPSAINLLADAVLEKGLHVEIPSIVTSSESLLDYQKAKFEKAFHAKVFDFYGNTEKCGYILTCPHGRKHLLLQSGFHEFKGDQLISTNLSNYAFPFIRYQTSDLIKKSSDGSCPCGFPGILVETILGRMEDYIVTKEGALVGRLDHIFKDALHVREAQIIL
jgi:phenylacetate-CoA ligase